VFWNKSATIADLQTLSRDTAAERCGVVFTQIGDQWVEATIPLDGRTRDLDGNLHPGALGVLAETIGSIAASLSIDNSRRTCMGQILQINHPVRVSAGPILARASPVSILEDRQVWGIEMRDSGGGIVCAAHLTMVVLDR